ncbi:hypothetical protein [Butyrivibrio sp. AE3004]|uniref:hypothetical protein n=1 Tax=Butyrivibrio sp. AE3004 TaxID=1506994 RepID=UPI000494A0EE|nr:hypothetical protein [Butyrivibrio sp. AE3004]
MNSVFGKIFHLFDNCKSADLPRVNSLLYPDDDSEEIISNDIGEKIEIVENNIALLSRQVMKNSYVKAIENSIRDIEEDVDFIDNSHEFAVKTDELKRRLLIGKENQNKLRKRVMSTGE